VLVSRSDRKRGGTSIVLADLQTRVAIEMSDSYQAKFIAGGKSLLITEGVETPSVFEMNLNGEVVSRLADGTVTDVCDEANAAIVLGQRPAKSPDDELFFLDLQTKELERIGSGARAVVFPNGKVLFTVGYECKAMIWQKDQGKPRAIDSPPGYNVGPNRSPGATVASFYIMPPSSPDRLYNIYLFDSDTELFSKVIVTLPSE
ncbi:MAG TPA: hypothetical protein VET25_00930, partial [Aestuariivirgaceae bacterium]|nr:hypothetical protein [Aestuariivirgaceae bacterium]